MSRDVAQVFADIDSFDPDRFVANLTEDARFRFANADPVTGRAAVREAVAGFFSSIDGLTHHIRNVYEAGDTVIAQIDVEYVRKDGKTVTVLPSWRRYSTSICAMTVSPDSNTFLMW